MSTCETFYDTGSCHGAEMVIMWICNVAAFLVFPISAIVAVAEFAKSHYYWIFTYLYTEAGFIPFSTDDVIMYILVSILIILSLFILVLVCLKGTVIRDAIFFDSFFSQFSKFIFIPVLIDAAAFFLGVAHKDTYRAPLAVCLVFVILAMACLATIYYFLGPVPENNWMTLIYKKGFISSLFVFNLYFFWYTIDRLVLMDNKMEDAKRCGYSFMVIMGLLIGVGIWFLREVFSGTFAWLLYVGFVSYSAMGGDHRKELRSTGELVVSIIFMILLLAEIVAVCVIHKKNVLI